ncbi:MAG: hypothetical protein M3437_10120 [Chloroflexota bacterium]|nr:hypothetical protein [Chloroflexota bacterium]MDQ5864742.1 hypothetical protein [Chloroflexota bacterium]
MSMERDRDWKAPLALVLAGLALFIALGGMDAFNFPQRTANLMVEIVPHSAEVVPSMRPEAFPAAPLVPTVVPAMPHMPELHFYRPGGFGTVTHDQGSYWAECWRWFGQMPSIMSVLLALALVFLGWRLLSQNRNQQAMSQAPAPPYANPGPGAPPPPAPPYYGDINQRQGDS